MSTIKVNKLEQRSGCTATVGGGAGKTVTVDATTVTLGRCGGTVSLAPGATQSGFGRSGSVNWCTTAKTSPFTAENGKGYFVNTSGGAVTVTLPSSPSAGDIVAVNDLNGTSDCSSKAITLGRNSSKINGACTDVIINTERQSTTIVYSGATQGWVAVGDANAPSSALNVQYNVRYLVVAGGGSGAGGTQGGGGGAGGYRTVCSANFAVLSGSSFPIQVGGGGTAAAPGPTDNRGNQGTPSIFSTITSTGGGGGAGNSTCASEAQSGGSGGGGACQPAAPLRAAGAGNTPPVAPPQGNPGGTGTHPGSGPFGWAGGGGGGAAAAGGAFAGGPPGVAGAGGIGATTDIFGSSPQAPSYGTSGPAPGRYFAGGGGGGTYIGTKGAGGDGGGGPGNSSGNNNGANGADNTGGGGGGGDTHKYTGGSGIVIIKHATADASPAVSGGNAVITCGSDTIRVFTGDGTFVS